MTRDQLDALAWATIDAHIPEPRKPSARPSDFVELYAASLRSDLELAWGNFLHDFLAHRDEHSFHLPPPPEFGLHWCALLAATAEYLSQRYGLAVPAWTRDPIYTLPEVWDMAEEECPGIEAGRSRRWENTPGAFQKRNIVFEARNLITP